MFLDLFFPNRCLHCNFLIDAEEIICEMCYDQIRFSNWEYSSDNPLKQKCNLLFPCQYAYAHMIFEKDSLARNIMHELKYKGREKIGKIIANWIIPSLNFGNQKPDLLVTVPLHGKKQRKRGYNQLHVFAETISKEFSIPHDHQVLKRNIHKKAQAFKNKKMRSGTENLFSISKKIQNQHVLIIDDVFTTGNTMATVAWEIVKEGNNTVSVLVMAID